jgi:hypothetical protein
VSKREVDAYLATLDEPHRSTLKAVRQSIAEIIPDAEQVMSGDALRVAAVSLPAGLMERRREADLDLSILLADEEGGLVKRGRPVLNSAVDDAEP